MIHYLCLPTRHSVSAFHRSLGNSAHSAIVLFLVVTVELRGLWIGGRCTVGVLEQALDASQNRAHALAGRPHLLNDIQAKGAITAPQSQFRRFLYSSAYKIVGNLPKE